MIRFFDLLLSIAALLALSPLLILIIVILSLTGEREIFYKQKRIGINGKDFFVLKFATMLKNSESIGSKTITIKDDKRVLFFGKFLRKTKINELPQLINVVCGSMSLVGPRPLVEEQFNFYEKKHRENITLVLPGITGLGSIVFRNEEKFFGDNNDPKIIFSQKIIPMKGILETWFIENKSIYNYFKIIFLTALSILLPNMKVLNFFDKELLNKYNSIFR
tara:strand:+ start:1669 stop:2328 length:660 start_codon:yes stop_codon:yes gene_type:complete